MSEHKYIRYRTDTGRWQVKIYNEQVRHSSMHTTLPEAIEARDRLLYGDGPRILILDIETTPMLAWTWDVWQTNIPSARLRKDWELLCVGYKWLGYDEVTVLNLWDYGWNEAVMAQAVYELLDEAHIVVAHNGNRFDIKRIQTKLHRYGFQRPSQFRRYDTLIAARRFFDITYNKLDYIDKFMGREGKMEHEGFELWLKCMDGDKDAQARMVAYNKQDILVLERVYLELRGWDPSHPNVGHYYQDDQLRCATCGSTELVPMKPVVTQVSKFSGYRCQNCGAVVRTRFRQSANQTVGVQ